MTAPLSVLFADHDLAPTRLLRMELRKRGARVDFTDTAGEVVHRASTNPPDLLILDESLQTQEDRDLVEFYHASAPETEIILMHDGEGSISHGLGMGLLLTARKPLARSTLVDVVDSAFPGRLILEEIPCADMPSLLCVDDDRATLMSLSRSLKRRGYHVVALESARSALELLPRLPLSLAIIDIMMPGVDGLALTRAIHETSGGRVPVVVLTALASDEVNYLALENGARYCLTKPCANEDLLNIVDYLAGNLDDEERGLLRARLGGTSLPNSRA
jgi:DNA-binding response OmpR family regulator